MIPKISGSDVQTFVKASMNLAGSENQKLAAKLQKEMKLADKTSTMQERLDSYISSKAPLSLPKEKAAEEIIPENSINFIA